MIISIETEKVFDKTQYPFMIKTLSKLEIEGNFLNLMKYICKETAVIILGEKFKTFLLRSGIRQGWCL